MNNSSELAHLQSDQTELVQQQPAAISRKHQQIFTKRNTQKRTNKTKKITKKNNKTGKGFIQQSDEIVQLAQLGLSATIA